MYMYMYSTLHNNYNFPFEKFFKGFCIWCACTDNAEIFLIRFHQYRLNTIMYMYGSILYMYVYRAYK